MKWGGGPLKQNIGKKLLSYNQSSDYVASEGGWDELPFAGAWEGGAAWERGAGPDSRGIHIAVNPTALPRQVFTEF